ncbi:type ISP restriction/modification enzyme [Ahrensia sp. R2A130]|uniref:type ISP restriction/modification enzyme n=1 Tax=Ahrensia sp. R2A130 TaxID=744979 RepID=UPI0001E0F109|nr:type ISP restriction/modification enzyme [Ahrensia sp. R2A130]EFL88046.1 adenine specific DNA methyltransferase [Ahrensia sp. R2A130]
MTIAEFVAEVQRLHEQGHATEHSYRRALGELFDSITADVSTVNEPSQGKSGRPDFVFLRQQEDGTAITTGHCEAKDIGLDISPRGMKGTNKDQFDRYSRALPNLIYTNCLDWRFYRHDKDGKPQLVGEITIADMLMGIQPKPDQFAPLWNLLRDFVAERMQTITSAERLAQMMAGKALLTRDVLLKALEADAELTTELAGQFSAFKSQLIHDLDIEQFADIYAETIAYGMFAARLHDDTKATFSRSEALTLLPKSNPFLRKLFEFVAGPSLNPALAITVDELAEIFQATDLEKLFENFGSFTQRNDPFIHFYETFLAAYNPAKRKARGVWYTPEPVVNFIVRAVDDVLKEEFGLQDGLADTSKVSVDWDTGNEITVKRKNQKTGKMADVRVPEIVKKDVHRVQILDPAAGTGTFLAEVIKQIAPRIKQTGGATWNRYVEEHLIPRLHGFELLMASYAMCHMKLDMMLSDLDYKPTATPPRLNVYLTNTLEEGEREVPDLLMARWLSEEARAANDVKNQTPIMCVIGNPPYSGESSNKGKGFEWITDLMDAYKKEPGGKEKLKERNPKWINDDYVKFIRFAEHMIEKTGEGVLGFITNHGYLDNPTFRGMRWHLLNTFDKIWVIDLHGSSKKKEVSPDGSADTNVFDIMPGVAMIIAVKRQNRPKAKSVLRSDLWGTRKSKYDSLKRSGLKSLKPTTLDPRAPWFSLTQFDHELNETYQKGFSLPNLFSSNVLGFQTHRDGFAIAETLKELNSRIEDLSNKNLTDATLREKYKVRDNRDWNLSQARERLAQYEKPNDFVSLCDYRPFDTRYCFLDEVTMDYPRTEIVKNFLGLDNLALTVSRQQSTVGFRHAFTAKYPANDCFVSTKSREANQVFPLYLYPDEPELDQTRRVNFDPKIRAEIEKAATSDGGDVPDEVAIFDYIYGVLHCPAYRETYAEFLKIDFPRILYPASPETFADISAKGTQLRRLHLMEEAAIGDTPFPFEGEAPDGEDGSVAKPQFVETGKGTGLVAINGTASSPGQHFQNVPKIAWEFFIGGYQPAQKWLKDRKGRTLSFDDIRHYQKIIKILSETDRIMKTIEMEFESSEVSG